MFGKAKTAKQILKMIAAMPDAERAALLEELGAEEEEAASDVTGETPEEVATENTDEAAAEEVSETEKEAETAEETEEAEKNPAAEGEEAQPETTEEAPKEDPLELVLQELKALSERVAEMGEFIDKIRGEDAKEKDELGLRKAEEERLRQRETYAEYRNRVVGT